MQRIFPVPLRWIIRRRFDKIRLYDNDALFLPLFGFPFFKKNAFYHTDSLVPLYGLKFIDNFTGYDSRLISSVVQRNSMKKPDLSKYIAGRLLTIWNRNKYHLLRRFNREIVK